MAASVLEVAAAAAHAADVALERVEEAEHDEEAEAFNVERFCDVYLRVGEKVAEPVVHDAALVVVAAVHVEVHSEVFRAGRHGVRWM